jgi:hypothetical protein
MSEAASRLPVDGRQSAAALAIRRGTMRWLAALGHAALAEVPLPSGRRADLLSLAPDGSLWIVEIKSSRADLFADSKWPDYRAHCDRLYFATSPDLPPDLFPDETGLILADAFGAALHRDAPDHRLAPATRRALLGRFAHLGALRLMALDDPHGRYGIEPYA